MIDSATQRNLGDGPRTSIDLVQEVVAVGSSSQ
jgi:hypothetical protein